MKRSVMVVMAVLLALGGFAGCSEKNTTYSNSDEVIRVKVGQEFVISLESNPSTGYSWDEVVSAPWLKMLGKSYKADEPVLMGSGGVELFRYKASAKGTATIVLGYKRPWESGAGQQRTFSVEAN
jgi:inhibitor of cysteine peptidase